MVENAQSRLPATYLVVTIGFNEEEYQRNGWIRCVGYYLSNYDTGLNILYPNRMTLSINATSISVYYFKSNKKRVDSPPVSEKWALIPYKLKVFCSGLTLFPWKWAFLPKKLK